MGSELPYSVQVPAVSAYIFFSFDSSVIGDTVGPLLCVCHPVC